MATAAATPKSLLADAFYTQLVGSYPFSMNMVSLLPCQDLMEHDTLPRTRDKITPSGSSTTLSEPFYPHTQRRVCERRFYDLRFYLHPNARTGYPNHSSTCSPIRSKICLEAMYRILICIRALASALVSNSAIFLQSLFSSIGRLKYCCQTGIIHRNF